MLNLTGAFVEINCIESSAKPLNINGRREREREVRVMGTDFVERKL